MPDPRLPHHNRASFYEDGYVDDVHRRLELVFNQHRRHPDEDHRADLVGLLADAVSIEPNVGWQNTNSATWLDVLDIARDFLRDHAGLLEERSA